MIILDLSPQGSQDWLAIRRGLITASRFKDARDRLKSGAPSKACLSYAMDCARERVGGMVPSVFQTAAMRAGTEQEPIARMQYEAQTGCFVEEAGFAYTDDKRFGVSVDGLIDADGVWECKTMVSSDTLFTAMVANDVSAYLDQCNGAMWLLGRKWVDLSLWCPDLQVLHTTRIERDDNAIDAMVDDLMSFERLVCEYEAKLRGAIGSVATPPATSKQAPATATA